MRDGRISSALPQQNSELSTPGKPKNITLILQKIDVIINKKYIVLQPIIQRSKDHYYSVDMNFTIPLPPPPYSPLI